MAAARRRLVVRADLTVRARLRESLEMRFLARGASFTFCDLDLVPVKERVLTVAAIPNSGRTVRTNATNNPNTAERFLEITDSFPIPGSDNLILMHEACQVLLAWPALVILRY